MNKADTLLSWLADIKKGTNQCNRTLHYKFFLGGNQNADFKMCGQNNIQIRYWFNQFIINYDSASNCAYSKKLNQNSIKFKSNIYRNATWNWFSIYRYVYTIIIFQYSSMFVTKKKIRVATKSVWHCAREPQSSPIMLDPPHTSHVYTDDGILLWYAFSTTLKIKTFGGIIFFFYFILKDCWAAEPVQQVLSSVAAAALNRAHRAHFQEYMLCARYRG